MSQQGGKRLPQIGTHDPVVKQVELLEERLVEQPPHLVWRPLVHGPAIGRQGEGVLDGDFDVFQLDPTKRDQMFRFSSLPTDALLFAAKQIDRDGVGVVRLQQLPPLSGQPSNALLLAFDLSLLLFADLGQLVA